MAQVEIPIKIIGNGVAPYKMTDGAVCFDCYSRLDVVANPNERVLVPLGFAMALPHGYEAVIRPRSGLTNKGIQVAIGTIDFDYRGELKAMLWNTTDEVFTVEEGMRICQLSVQKVPDIIFVTVDQLDDTERSGKGFGSTGA